MYRSIGLIPGVHYVVYNNTMEGLEERIRYYQVHEEELERIAANGTRFVRDKFNGKTAAEKFMADLMRLSETAKNSMPSFNCSFVEE
jgi:spore maturation protein CgeB